MFCSRQKAVSPGAEYSPAPPPSESPDTAKVKHLLRCEGDDAQHDHRRLRGNQEPTAAQVRLDGKQGKRASKGVRFRQDMFYPVHTDELYCPLEPGDSLPLHTNPAKESILRMRLSRPVGPSQQVQRTR